MGTERLTVICSCFRPVELAIPARPHWRVKVEAPCRCGKTVTYVFPPAGWSRWMLLEVD